MQTVSLTLPYTPEALAALRTGQRVFLSGVLYTARDAAHGRLCALLDNGQPPPFRYEGAGVFYAGPCPAPPGFPCGSIGPTTSGRMDAYTPRLLREGLRLLIGKGPRNEAVMNALRETGGVYLAAVGGAAALTAACVEAVETIAFADLGTEAVRALRIRNMPLIVAADRFGTDIYSTSFSGSA